MQKYKFFMNRFSKKNYVRFLLLISVGLALFLSTYKWNTSSPPCINADEAAFGYNSYSILKTGADEFGHVLPLRLKSFGDYKMPLYSYLSVPFIGLFGLNDIGVRGLNVLLGAFLPIIVFFITKELFKRDEPAVIAALLTGVSLGFGMVQRQAHEAILAVFLISFAVYFFVRFIKTEKYKFVVFFVVSIFLSLFAYQSSRLYALFFLVCVSIYIVAKKNITKIRAFLLISFVISLSIFAITDIVYKPERVNNLFLISNPGFSLRTLELIREGGSRAAYNKFALGTRDVVFQHIQYFSPQFLAINGDSNMRFGFQGMSPMTPLEYIFIFIGLYFLFRNKERFRYFILSIFLISPLSASLSWNQGSITRSLFILIPAIIISSYGVYNVLTSAYKRKIFFYLLFGLVLIQSIFLYYSWDFYFNHYPKRALVQRTWQCGYKELARYIKNNYNDYDKFYITRKNGEPYIFLLYYLNYPPEKYEKQATLTAPDEYGFGQVEKFDKFIFSFPPSAAKEKKVVLVGYPDDFGQISEINKHKLKKITIGREDIFWIYEL